MSQKIILILFLIFFDFMHLNAQEKTFVVEHLEKEEYLPIKYSVRDIQSDNRGYLWVGTTNGLKFFDGYSFHNLNEDAAFTIPIASPIVNCIMTDSTDLLYIGTRLGLTIINLKEKTSQDLLLPSDTTHSEFSVYKGIIIDIISTTGNKIWFSDGYVLGTLDNNNQISWFHEKLVYPVFYLLAGDEEDFWAITNEKGIYHLKEDGTILKHYPPIYINQKEDTLNLTFTKAINNDLNNGLLLFSPYKSLNSQFIVYNRNLQDLEFSKNENQINKIKTVINDEAYPFNDPIISTFLDAKIQNYHRDANNLVWICGEAGIFKFTDVNQHIFTKPEAFSNKWIEKIYQSDSGLLYIATLGVPGLFSLDLGKKEIKPFWDFQNCTDIIEWSKDTLLISTSSNGLYLFDSKKGAIIKNWIPEGKNIFYELEKDREATIWSTWYLDLFEIEEKNYQINSISDKQNIGISFKERPVKLLGLDKADNLWISYFDELLQLSKSSGVEQKISLSKKNKQYKNIEFRQLQENNKKQFWLGTNAGIFLYDVQRDSVIHHYTEKNGLSGNNVKGIFLEADSILWITTSTGLSRLDIHKEIFQNFNQLDGLTNNEFVDDAILKANDGNLYLGTINGLNILNPKQLNKKNYPKNNTLIPKIIIYDSQEGISKTDVLPLLSEKEIVLKPNDKYIDIYMANSDFSQPTKNLYEYQLIGFDEKSILTNSNAVRYTNLNPGNYIFQVKSKAANGEWSQNLVQIPIEVQEVFYKRKSFQFILFFLFSLGVISFYQYLLRNEKKLSKFRQDISDSIHNDISNSLAFVRMLTKELLEKVQRKSDKEELGKIFKVTEQTLDNIYETIWATDTSKDTIGELVLKMKKLLANVVNPKEIEIDFQVLNLVDGKKIDFLIRRNIWLIFKEAIGNILKHTDANYIKIVLNNQNKKFYMLVSNNFSGLEKKSVNSSGRGFLIMEKKAKEINGSIIQKKEQNHFSLTLLLDRKL